MDLKNIDTEDIYIDSIKAVIIPPYKNLMDALRANLALLRFIASLPWPFVNLFVSFTELEEHVVEKELHIEKKIIDFSPLCEYIKRHRNGCIGCPFRPAPQINRTCGIYYDRNKVKNALCAGGKQAFYFWLNNLISRFEVEHKSRVRVLIHKGRKESPVSTDTLVKQMEGRCERKMDKLKTTKEDVDLLAPPYKDMSHAIKATIKLFELMIEVPWVRLPSFKSAIELRNSIFKTIREPRNFCPMCGFLEDKVGLVNCTQCPLYIVSHKRPGKMRKMCEAYTDSFNRGDYLEALNHIDYILLSLKGALDRNKAKEEMKEKLQGCEETGRQLIEFTEADVKLITPPYADLKEALSANARLFQLMEKLPWAYVKLFDQSSYLADAIIKDTLGICRFILNCSPVCQYFANKPGKCDGCPFRGECQDRDGFYSKISRALKRGKQDEFMTGLDIAIRRLMEVANVIETSKNIREEKMEFQPLVCENVVAETVSKDKRLKALFDSIKVWEFILSMTDKEFANVFNTMGEKEASTPGYFVNRLKEVAIINLRMDTAIWHFCPLCEFHRKTSACPLSLNPSGGGDCGYGCVHKYDYGQLHKGPSYGNDWFLYKVAIRSFLGALKVCYYERVLTLAGLKSLNVRG